MVFRSIILSSAREQILEATQIMSPLAILKLSFFIILAKVFGKSHGAEICGTLCSPSMVNIFYSHSF